jgi:hypothetical protein
MYSEACGRACFFFNWTKRKGRIMLHNDRITPDNDRIILKTGVCKPNYAKNLLHFSMKEIFD